MPYEKKEMNCSKAKTFRMPSIITHWQRFLRPPKVRSLDWPSETGQQYLFNWKTHTQPLKILISLWLTTIRKRRWKNYVKDKLHVRN